MSKYYEIDKAISDEISRQNIGNTYPVTCPTCNGSKAINGEQCEDCSGTGDFEYEYTPPSGDHWIIGDTYIGI